MRIIRELRPPIFIFENVKGLFTSNQGYDFLSVLEEITNSGYDGQWQLINTKWFLPQNRERIYFIGNLGKGSGSKVFPIQTTAGSHNECPGSQTVNNIDGNYWKGCDNHGQRTMIQIPETKGNSQSSRVYKTDGISHLLSSNGGWQGAKTGLYEVPMSEGNRELIESDDLTIGCITGALNKDALIKQSNIRRLTPIECARLQGFSDDWHNGLSDSMAYKCYGNAVSVPVVKAIAERLRACNNPQCQP